MADSHGLEGLDLAREAVRDKDWATARRVLAPIAAQDPQGFGAFLLARTELEVGRPEVAAPLVDAFLGRLPRHAGARVLKGRIQLALGNLESALQEAEAAQALSPDNAAAERLLERLREGQQLADCVEHVAVVDARHAEARSGVPGPELMQSARALASMPLPGAWTRDPLQAKVAYFHHASDLEWALRNYDPSLVEVSARFDYITWPRRIQEFVRGRSVLDVGCGFGGFGMGFLIAGARDYVGLDPAMDLDSTRAKNKRTRQWADMGVTPRALAKALPAIRLDQSTSEDMAVEETFDTVALHNVTEHLLQLDDVLSGLVARCRPDSRLVFLHHNFYCWNGHHQAPNRPEQLDVSNPRHREIYDWRHIDLVPSLPEDHYYRTHLNRVRLEDLRQVTEKYFDILIWDEVPSSPETVARLTPEVVERVRRTVPDITEQELKTNVVFCVAQPRPVS